MNKRIIYFLWSIGTLLSILVYIILSITIGPVKFHEGAWRGFAFLITQYCVIWGILLNPQVFNRDKEKSSVVNTTLQCYLFTCSILFNIIILCLIAVLFLNDNWTVSTFVQVSTLLTIAAGALLIPQLKNIFE